MLIQKQSFFKKGPRCFEDAKKCFNSPANGIFRSIKGKIYGRFSLKTRGSAVRPEALH